MVYWN